MRVLSNLLSEIERMPTRSWRGEIRSAAGMTLEVEGLRRVLAVGDKCWAETARGQRLLCETIGFRQGRTLLMAFDNLDGVAEGCAAVTDDTAFTLRPGPGWLGRVVNALGEPIDGRGPLRNGHHARPLRAAPPPAYARRRVGAKMDTGVRAIDVFTPICRGQRMGVFAGSGVGKSTLLSMVARHAGADAIVIGLVGERGREVQEFIQDDLGADGLARSVVVVATSDEPPLMRRQAAYLCLTVAEELRDRGLHVLCLIDSVTRFAMAQREIGLAAGEPPTAKSYPPSVFAELPKLMERAGPGQEGQGDITGIFTVLVDGDDHDEPIADAVRGILDGHIVLDRRIAEQGRYPAVNVLRSVSRLLPGCHTAEQNALLHRARSLAATYDNMRELVRIGAYKPGTDAEVDGAVALNPALEEFLRQGKDDATPSPESFHILDRILAVPAGATP
ncbi:flagellar protein export ATPase FliI [Azospirillum argentinense]|uniref:Flagellum-specific ATP synthase n=1 Tax=Azospirillum argentinense TaxID=2970906 RepID=A0A5B0KZQ1_9PROT|nr:flagellar protein export ATPase FliI [Azospirillum argentinense]KAA1056838.1 Flagellum-specific ATP synthase FliI [Azospirillum argentinense]